MKKRLRLIIIIFLLIIGGIMFFLSNQIHGFRSFVVTSASMEPTIPTGALLITQYTQPNTLQKDDIITFLPPIHSPEFVTHRITKAAHEKNLSTFKTKGDNNPNEDTWNLAGGAIVGKVIVTIPLLGYIFSFTQSPLGIIFFVLLPAVYIIIDELITIFELIKNKAKNVNKISTKIPQQE